MVRDEIVYLAHLLFFNLPTQIKKNVEQGLYALTSITLVLVEFIPQLLKE